MKKLSFFWILALVICSVISCAEKEQFEQELQTQKREQLREKLSHEVTQAEARVKLEKMLTNSKLPSTRGGDTNSLPPITSVYTTGKAAVATRAGEEVEPYFHIFNFGDNEGFAIMSGDDRIPPMLALTFKGELIPGAEIDNPNFEIVYSRMEDYYVNQISSRALNPGVIEIPPKDSIPAPIIKDSLIYHEPQMGYCQVQWGQGWPYNINCTIPPVNNTAYTGCARVAVAQLMSMYKYPNSYTNAYGITDNFNWDDMIQYTIYKEGRYNLNPYLDDSTKYKPIARLMYQLGISANLNVSYNIYYPDEPGSSHPDNIPITFENFGYTNGGNRITYDTNTVVGELLDGYPVLIGGSDESDGQPRHRWLGHGVLEQVSTFSYYHLSQGWITLPPTTCYHILCNFGWDGEHDGYYLSEVFDTMEGPVYSFDLNENNSTRSNVVDTGNYSYNMDVVINIRR